MKRKIPTKQEIIAAAAMQGIAIPKNHVMLDMAQTAYRKVEERGGIEKISQDIQARIEAARARLANSAA